MLGKMYAIFLKNCRGCVSRASYDYLSIRFKSQAVEDSQEILNFKTLFPSNSKLLNIAIVGEPNSGKSTLINQLVGWRVCSVSQKVHTTVINARAIKNIGSTQLIFLDTPGLVTNEEVKKHKLKSSMVQDPEHSMKFAECIGVLHDVSNKYTRHVLHPKILRLLALYPLIPSILILNKVDRVAKKDLLLKITNQLTGGSLNNNENMFTNSIPQNKKDYAHNEDGMDTSDISSNDVKSTLQMHNIIENEEQKHDLYDYDPINSMFTPEDVYSGKIKLTENQLQYFLKKISSWPKFDEVFMISALDGTGVDSLRSFFTNMAHPCPWTFPSEAITDQSPQVIAIATVRAKCLEHLSHNIPYKLQYEVAYWDISEADVLSILMNVICATKGHMKLLIGRSGVKVTAISKEAEQELRNTFRTEVRLRINFEYRDPDKK